MNKYLEVNWAEGLFLRPHHLQQFSRQQVASLQDCLAMARPFPWGFNKLKLSDDEIATEVISIRACDLRFRDGTHILVPDNARVEPRSFKRELDSASGSLSVYLAIPQLMEREPNTLAQHEEKTVHQRRYKASTIECEDENTGDNAQQIEVRRHNPVILFEGENFTNYDRIKVAQIVRSGLNESKPAISVEFAPPLLDLAAWPPLFEAVRDLYHQLFAKNRALAAQIVGRKVAFGSEGVGGPEAMLRLNVTNRHVAFLQQYTAISHVHPFDIYLQLCNLAGDLAIFDNKRAIPELPIYDHDDPSRCFSELITLLQRFLNNLIPTTFIRTKFVPVGDHLEVTLLPEWLTEATQFYLGIESHHEIDVIDNVQSKLKMAAPEQLLALRHRRIPGLMGRRSHRVPIGLPDRPDIHYFEINRDHHYWEEVKRDKVLGCIDLEDPTLQLYLYVLLNKPDRVEPEV